MLWPWLEGGVNIIDGVGDSGSGSLVEYCPEPRNGEGAKCGGPGQSTVKSSGGG